MANSVEDKLGVPGAADAPVSTSKKAAGRHTPGPWGVRFRFGRLTTVSGRQRYPICDTGTAPLAEANHGREEANARLIAAAPAMLQALEASLTMVELVAEATGEDTDWAVANAVRDILAKVAGR